MPADFILGTGVQLFRRSSRRCGMASGRLVVVPGASWKLWDELLHHHETPSIQIQMQRGSHLHTLNCRYAYTQYGVF